MSASLISVARAPRRLPWPRWAIAIVALWLVGVAIFTWVTRAHDPAPTLCMFRNVTGVPCPTCGSTRLVLAAGRGDLRDALLLNPMVSIVLGLFAAWLVMRLGLGRTVRLNLTRGTRRALWIIAVILFVANWAYVIWREGP